MDDELRYEAPRRNNGAMAAIIGLATLAVVVVGLLIWALLDKNNDPDAPTVPPVLTTTVTAPAPVTETVTESVTLSPPPPATVTETRTSTVTLPPPPPATVTVTENPSPADAAGPLVP